MTGADAELNDNAETSTIDSDEQAAPDDVQDEPERVKRPGFVYFLGYGIMAPVARIVFRPKIIGRENIPATGRVILASNHLSFIDSIVIPLVATRRVQFLAKSTYFTGTGFKGWVSRTFFTAIGAIGVERGAGQAAQVALDAGRSVLDTEGAFAIYPEGTRSLDGRLYKGRTGVAWLALTTGAVVVPVGLIGTQEIQPVGTTVPRIRKVTVTFGEPLDLSHHGPATSGKARRQATDEIMAAIHQLSGQELANAYNESPPVGTLNRLAHRVFPRERL
ncbi:lysophospholipid acyltransferase family protein [Cryobacterium sp. M91]|uniref:1-acyl-sn-glycerol-3-phosphate acyltransferase n=2 Tax=Cryobacterium levicorallinum TaxID=995038 RepID=A0ABY1EEF7_9MICO|nr:1-acyl-sn-glycerol-3-phosphate acyltransferase [Cryobacterium levicorallinum]SFH58249.1 1-acyl-sn-glycerol-3-phosphate acyltransferase [Cryobacterium levicorallinum]